MAFWIGPEIPVTVKRIKLSTFGSLAPSTCRKVDVPAFLSGSSSFTWASASAIKVSPKEAGDSTDAGVFNPSVAVTSDGTTVMVLGVQARGEIAMIKKRTNRARIAILVFRTFI